MRYQLLASVKVFLTLLMVAHSLPDALAEVRTWRDSSGRYTVDAELVRQVGDSVTLRRAGKTSNIPMSKLSRADRDFVVAAMQQNVPSGGSPLATSAVSPEVALLRAENAELQGELKRIKDQLAKLEAPRAPTVLPEMDLSGSQSANSKAPSAVPVEPNAPTALIPDPNAVATQGAAEIIAGLGGAQNEASALHSSEKALDRTEPRSEVVALVDEQATEMDNRLAEVTAEAQKARVESLALSKQITELQVQARRYNSELTWARNSQRWDIITNHQDQLLMIRDRITELRKSHAALAARYAALDFEATQLQEQVKAQRRRSETRNVASVDQEAD